MRPAASTGAFAADGHSPRPASDRHLTLFSLVGRRAAMWLCGVLVLSAVHARTAWADDSAAAKAWLDKITAAGHTVSYEGTFVYRRDDQLVTMHVIHVAGADGEREQLVSLSGGRRELVRSKDGVVCIFPGRQHVTFNKRGLDKRFPGNLAGRVDDLEKNYRLTLGGNDRIAGRAARMVLVEPLDRYRYGYRIWIDEQTGLLLQSDVVNEQGNAIEQVMFTNLTVMDKATPDMIKAVTLDPAIRRGLMDSKQQIVPVTAMPWHITQMPKGFTLAEHYQHINGKHAPVDQMVLTDGMATVSVFVEPMKDGKSSFKGMSHMGAVNAFGAVVDDHQLTVVGEVPAATVQLIGDSVDYTQADAVR